ncbi:MAG: hypothetical protein COC15_03600, partial [Legionellales bacterium]
ATPRLILRTWTDADLEPMSAIKKLATLWDLTNIQPINNVLWNFVAKATQNDSTPVVLKICRSKKNFDLELQASKYFIKIIDYNTEHNALLLNQAIPGDSLKSQEKNLIAIYVDIVRNICKATKSAIINNNFPHIRDWLSALDQARNNKIIPEILLNKAIVLRDNLFVSAQPDLLLHGDLHFENILQHHDTWIVIDPKGIIGELEFEVAKFDFDFNNPKNFHNQVKMLSAELDLDLSRLTD